MTNNSADIVSGPILRAVIRLAVPVMLGMFMEFALAVTDLFWVGKLGAAAQDALTSSLVVIWSVFATSAIISVGITALVSRHMGAGEPERAGYYTWQGLLLALFVAATISVTGVLGTESLLRFMGTSAITLNLAVPYLRIFFLSTVLFALSDTAYAAFRASGDTRTPMIVSITAIALNMVLDPLLIFGIGPFPALGVTGAGVATALSILLTTAIIMRLLFTGRIGFRLASVSRTRPHVPSMLKIARIGIPVAGQHLVFICVYWFLIKYVHEFGEAAGAAMGIGNRMESFAYLTCYGLSVAASTLVGQNLGAGNPKRASQCAWGAVGLGISLTVGVTVILLTIPDLIAGLFSDDPEVLAIAIDYLIILGLSQMTMAIEIILEGSFSGAGNTVPPMLVGMTGSLSRIPLAYFLAFTLGWGINGIWWTLTITTVVKAALLSYWFRRGGWQTRQI